MPDASAHPLLALLQSFVTQIGGYFLVVGVLFLVVWVWGRRRLATRRIQKVKRFTTKQLRHELLYTVVTFVAGTGCCTRPRSSASCTRCTTRAWM